jgi:2-polyprenyl-6-methoxyphenol hydroxylase-like FAD-dependent oxidoreductase
MKTTLQSAKSASNHSLYDVIISGAGPVGLFLAGELALAHCAVLVLEKAENATSPLKQIPFGIRGLNALSIEALDRRGLLQELELHKRLKNPHQNAGQGARRQVGHFAGIPFYEDNVDPSQWSYRLPSSTETSLMSELAELETVLVRRAEALGVVIERGLGIAAFEQSETGVTVQAGGKSFAGKWLVGCDGSRSVVRKVGGFEFAGTEPEFTGYTTRLDLADPAKLKPGRHLTPTGMYLQSQPGYVMLQDFDGGAFHDSGQPATLEHVQAVLRRVSGTDVTVSALHVATTWTDRARQATAYRHGRVLLAGDAAHIHSPLGGQGLNLGLGDAMNLGWKLAATIHGQAPAGLLDSYDTERNPIGAQVLDWSRAQVAIMRPGPAARALQAITRDLLDTRDGATYFAGRVWGISTHYDLGGEHPLTGHSVPNLAFEDGATLGELLRGGQGILLDLEGSAILEAATSAYADRIKYVKGHAKEPLGLSALLVRPDGFVAWATNKTPDASAFQQAAARWFSSNYSLPKQLPITPKNEVEVPDLSHQPTPIIG